MRLLGFHSVLLSSTLTACLLVSGCGSSKSAGGNSEGGTPDNTSGGEHSGGTSPVAGMANSAGDGGSSTGGAVADTGGSANPSSGGNRSSGGSAGSRNSGGSAGANSSAGGGAGGSAGASSRGGAASGGSGRGGSTSTAGAGAYLIPNPIVSRGKEIISPQDDAINAFDGDYKDDAVWNGDYSKADGSVANTWVKVHVGSGPTALLLAWHHLATPDYTIAPDINYGAPSDYTIDVSPDGSDGSWKTVVNIKGPSGLTYRSRAHRFDFTGMSWVRLTLTKCLCDHIQISEVDIHDVSAGSEDTWLVAGSGSTRFLYDGSSSALWPELVHTAHPAYYPALIDIADVDSSSDFLVQKLDEWIALNPDYRYWVLVYGLHDAEGGAGETGSFKSNMQAAIDKLKAAGKVAVIPRIQKVYDSLHPAVPAYNAVIDALVSSNGLPAAPDLYSWFTDHPEQLCKTGCEGPADIGVVPTDAGAAAINTLWAQATDGLYAP